MSSTSRPSPTLFNLPQELFDEVIGYLPPDAIINLAFAGYHPLSQKVKLPSLSLIEIENLEEGEAAGPAFGHIWPLPVELTLQILTGLSPWEIIHFVLTEWTRLQPWGFLPTLNDDTVQSLVKAAVLGRPHGSLRSARTGIHPSNECG